MRLPRLAVLVALLSLIPGGTPGQSPVREGELIVKYRKTATPKRVAAVQASIDASVARTFAGGERLLRVRGIGVAEAIARLTADPAVAYAEPNYPVSIDATFPNDPRFGELYGLNNTGQGGGLPDADIDAPEAWDVQTGGDVRVFVLDTGIDRTHPDLAANVWTNPGEIPDNGVDDDGNGYVDDVHGWDFHNNDNDAWDDNHHGTHVSGIIAAVGNNGVGVTGVCWSARIVPLKMIGGDGRGTIAEAIEAIDYAVAMGARITNNSWGATEYSQALADAVARAEAAGTLVIAAAGNSRVSADLFPNYPGSFPNDNVISVANTTAKDELSFVSNYGPESVDLAAPGDAILSTFPGGGYALLTGTSMATPHVSGAAALLVSEAPYISASEIKSILLATTDSIPALTDMVVTGGRLNVARALAALDTVPPSVVTDLRVATTGSNTVTLSWTARGDDGDTGAASAVDIRYALEPITHRTFDQATPATVDIRPQSAGATDFARVSGLNSNTTYYFAMRLLDERLNASPVSNSTEGTTLGPATIAVWPSLLSDRLFTGASSSHTLWIQNTGAGTLDFHIPTGHLDLYRAEPDAGTIFAGDTAQVVITFDAMGVGGGNYSGDIVIESNAAGQPETRVVRSLVVLSAPHLVAIPASVDFDGVFVGAFAERAVAITNAGDQDLFGELTVAAPDVALTQESFTIAPGDTQTVELTFAPATAGALQGGMLVTSNDPDDGETVVRLSGTGVAPPVAAVTPHLFEASLRTGSRETHTLNIRNTGATPLEWWVDVADTSASSVSDDPEAFRDLSGVRILFDQAHRNLHRVNWIVLTGELQQRGARVVAGSDPFTPEFLRDFDVVWITDLTASPADEEITALADWVRDGGGLFLEGDNNGSADIFNDILSRLGAGLAFSKEDGVGGVTSDIAPHEMTRNVDDIVLNRNTASIVIGRRPAGTLVRDVEGIVNTAFSVAGSGRVVVTADETFSNSRMAHAGNLTLAKRVFDWLAFGVGWLHNNTRAGIVAPGEVEVIPLALDATNIASARLVADVAVHTNDPIHPRWTTPTILSVQPAPDVLVAPDSIVFPPTAVERYTSRPVTIYNIGSQTLTVSKIITNNDDITAKPQQAVIPAGASREIQIIYTPTVAGASTAQLYVLSDDPGDGVVTLDVHAGAFLGTPGTRTIHLEPGDNLVSWNIDTDPDYTVSILASILPDLVTAIGYEGGGLSYTPGGFPQHNTLFELDHLHAYWLRVSRPRDLTVHGFVVDPQTAIVLEEGANTIGYLPATADSLEHALAGIIENVSFVAAYENGEGTSFDPLTPEANTLHVMHPGQGYWVVMTAPDTLVYPEESVIDSAPIPIPVPDPPSTPFASALYQNFPNPFNPSTTIRYALEAAGDVHLDVYNVRGQRVATLVDRRQEAGYHVVEWDGRNTAGIRVASGVYFYRMRADNFVATRKMILIQ